MFTYLYIPMLSKKVEIPFLEDHQNLVANDKVVLEMDEQEQEYAVFISSTKKLCCNESLDWKIIRKCNQHDLQIIQRNETFIQEKKSDILKAIKDLELNMSFVRAQVSFDNKKILIVFTSDNRVDFRKLVRILAGTFKKKIQLLQIGVKDRARILGEYGVCGKKLCCKSFLTTMPSVVMDAAREQNIAFKGAESLSGMCDKLKCCLNFELEQYKKLKKLFPKHGENLTVDGKEFSVISTDILNKKIKLKHKNDYLTLTVAEFNEKAKK